MQGAGRGGNMYQKIVVPLDGSKLAECVLPHVEAIANGCSTEEVILVTVTERIVASTGVTTLAQPEGTLPPLHPVIEVPAAIGKKQRQGERYLKRIAKRLQKKGIKVQTEVLLGNPAEEIANCPPSVTIEGESFQKHQDTAYAFRHVFLLFHRILAWSTLPLANYLLIPTSVLRGICGRESRTLGTSRGTPPALNRCPQPMSIDGGMSSDGRLRERLFCVIRHKERGWGMTFLQPLQQGVSPAIGFSSCRS